MPSYGFKIINLTSSELVLPEPVNRIVDSRKEIVIVLEDPNVLIRNTTYIAMVNAHVIEIGQVPVDNLVPPPPPPFLLVPGPPGPPGPAGPPGSGGDAGVYTCPSLTAIGNIVKSYADGAVDKASANAEATMPVLGIVISKSSTTDCVVQYRGEIPLFAGLLVNTLYYASTVPGTITNIAPSGLGKVIQRVGIAKNPTTLVLDIDEYIVL